MDALRRRAPAKLAQWGSGLYLRIVCAFLNSINHDKRKKHTDPRDPPTSWTESLWQYYIDAWRGWSGEISGK